MGTKKYKQLETPLTTVRAIIKKFQTSGTVANLPGRGHKCILSPRTVRKMVREAKKNSRTTVQELQTLVASWGHKVSKSTIRRHLHTNRLFGRVAQRRPLLRATNKFKHLEFAKRHWNYDWNRVVWPDKTKMEPFGHLHCVSHQKRDAYNKGTSCLPSNMVVDH